MSSARVNDGTPRERTQLFANVRPYQPSQMMRGSASSVTSGPLGTPLSAASGTYGGNGGTSYSDAVLNQLEAQNDDHVDGLSAKVRMLKDISLRIGDEVRDSSSLLNSLENRFEGARTTVKSTVTRLVRTADRSGVSWRSWLTLIAIIVFCFWLVLLL